jgi:hypothetical protein
VTTNPWHPGDIDEGPPPQREAGATLPAEEAAQLLTNRESIRAAYEAQKETK